MADWRPLLVVVGRMVKYAREAQGLSQTALAARAGVHVKGVREIEHGRGNPAFPTLARLVRDGLRISPTDLIVAAEREVSEPAP